MEPGMTLISCETETLWSLPLEGTTEDDEMAGWHHRFDGREFE